MSYQYKRRDPAWRPKHEPKAKPHSAGRRRRVWAKTAGHCFYCERGPLVLARAKGEKVPADYMQIDHVEAWIAGGTDDENNLVPACAYCNNQKRSMPAKVFAVIVVLREFVRGGRS